MRRRPDSHIESVADNETATPVRRNGAAAHPMNDPTPKHRNGVQEEDEKKQDIGDLEHGHANSDESSSHRYQQQQHQNDHPSLYLPNLPGKTRIRYKYKQSDSSLPDGSDDTFDGLPIHNSTWRKRKRRRSSASGGNSICGRVLQSSSTKLPKITMPSSENSKLVVAVLLWYSLGVVSISTSKLLLTPYHHHSTSHYHEHDKSDRYLQYYQHVGGLPPLFLTIQQLILGCTFLRFLLSVHFLHSPGLHSMETILAMAKIFPKNTSSRKKRNAAINSSSSHHDDDDQEASTTSEMKLLWDALQPSSTSSSSSSTVLATCDTSTTTLWYLLKAGICFSLGFYTTNLAFQTASSPAFVETVKAAEPITSAILAVTWGIDTMTSLEVTGLAGIITGVLLSTSASSSSNSTHHTQTAAALAMACGVVMTSNLCFSLRGLYQKLFRRGTAPVRSASAPTKPSSSSTTSLLLPPPPTYNKPTKNEPNLTTQQQTQAPQLDDLNLQFRMQQTGVIMLAIPTLFWWGTSLLSHALRVATVLSTRQFIAVMAKYFALSCVNGLAFSSYNLASTYILTRVAVIHHAALNCTRRIFAIVCTSIIFMTPITYLKAFGITVSFLSFMLFTYAKTTKNENATKTVSSLSKAAAETVTSKDTAVRSKI